MNGARDVPARSGFERGTRASREWMVCLQPWLLRSGTSRAPFIAPHEEFGDFLDWILCSGKADALERTLHQGCESFHGQGQVRAAPISDDGMNLIHDQSAGGR